MNCHPSLVRTVADSSLTKTCLSLGSENGDEPSQLSGHHTAAGCLAEHLRVQLSLLHVVLQPVSVLPSQCGDLNGTSSLSWMGVHGVWDWDKAKLVRVQSIV